MERFKVIEVVSQVYEYEVEANSHKQAEDNVRRGLFKDNREMDSKTAIRTYPKDATYTAKEL